MNREIKFRGKRVDNGEWIYGCLTRYSEAISYITNDLIEYEVYQVLSETVGQYTGKNDRNGNEIYEKSNIKFAKWNNGDLCWEGKVYYENCLWIVKGGPNKECECPFEIQLSGIPSERMEVQEYET